MLAMTGSVSHTLNIADQAMDLAEQFMTEGELINSDAYRVLENLTCVCEDALRVLCNAISKHPEVQVLFRAINLINQRKHQFL